MAVRLLRCSLAACATLAAALSTPGQTGSTPPALHADDTLFARFGSPARLREALRATNLGVALGDESRATLRDSLATALQSALAGIDPGLRATALAVVDALDQDGGSFTLGFEVASEHLPASRPAAIPFAGTLAYHPDPGADLDALRDRFDAALRASGIEPATLTLGDGTELRYLPVAGGGVSLPRRCGNELRIDFGIPFAAAVEARARVDAPWQADRAFLQASAALHVDLQRAMRSALVFRRFYGESRWAARVQACGLDSPDSLRLTMRPSGPYLEFESALRFHPGRSRGVFAGLFPATTTPPRLAMLVPEAATAWQALPLDGPPIYRAWCLWLSSLNTVDATDAELDRHVERYEEAYELRHDFRPGTDLLPHCEGHALLASSLGATRTELAAVELQDHEAFARAWPAVLRRWGDAELGAATGEVDHPDATIHLRADGCWAITEQLLVVARGEHARAWCEEVLDRCRDLRRHDQSLDRLPEAIRRRLPQAPPGVDGCGSLRTDLLLTPWLAARCFGVDDEFATALADAWTRTFADLEPDLRERGLEQAFGWSGWDEEQHTWRYRILW